MAARAPVVTGGPETAAAFEQLRGDVRAMPDAYETVARARLGAVARLTPVRTGELAGAWEATGGPTAGSIVSPISYAAPIEYGTSRGVRAARMVGRTLEAERDAIAAELEAAIVERGKLRGFRVA